MIKRICFSAALTLILTLVGLSPVVAQDTGAPDSLWVDSTTAFVTGIGIVPITFFNDEELAVVEVTLKHVNNQIKIDSFSFVDGRVADSTYNNEALVSDDSSTIWIASFRIGDFAIPAGHGLLGNLYYSYSQTIMPQVVPIDTITWQVGPILRQTTFRIPGGTRFVPAFERGYLHLLEAPESYDSLWVDRVEAVPGMQVELDVNAYNERPLARVATAFSYATDELTLDSVRFTGTRSEDAPTKTVQIQQSQHKVYTAIEFAVGSPLPTGTGPIMRLFFTVSTQSLEGVITIDTTTFGVAPETRFTLTDNDGGLSLVPHFRPGWVDVKIYTDVEDITDPDALPSKYALNQNYPNPFNPSTTIEFSLPESGEVEIEVFNVLGRKVRRLLQTDLPAGVHRIVFDGLNQKGKPLATGVYFYRMSTEQFTNSRKMLLLK